MAPDVRSLQVLLSRLTPRKSLQRRFRQEHGSGTAIEINGKHPARVSPRLCSGTAPLRSGAVESTRGCTKPAEAAACLTPAGEPWYRTKTIYQRVSNRLRMAGT